MDNNNNNIIIIIVDIKNNIHGLILKTHLFNLYNIIYLHLCTTKYSKLFTGHHRWILHPDLAGPSKQIL